MAQIVINEISQNYTYSIGATSYATVALPITASWGPAYVCASTTGNDITEALEETEWQHFPATQQGLESFVTTYRGPASNYRLTKDYSYQMAMTLLTSGYDVLICRVSPGQSADGTLTLTKSSETKTIAINAKYVGSFGNNIKVKLSPVTNRNYWNLVVYIVDNSGIQSAVENIIFAFDESNTSDTILHVDEIESKYITITAENGGFDPSTASSGWSAPTVSNNGEVRLANGTDVIADPETATGAGIKAAAKALATTRYTGTSIDGGFVTGAGYDSVTNFEYFKAWEDVQTTDLTALKSLYQMEWIYNAAFMVYQLLNDKLNYAPQRIISPGWDDQNYCAISGEAPGAMDVVSPLHKIIMDVAYHGRCATGMIDIPKSCARSEVYSESATKEGYAQKLARIDVTDAGVNAQLYTSHSAIFAPWGQIIYVGTRKQSTASPAFIALLIQRAQIQNQSLQYEWALPTNRKHNLKLGKFDYKVPKKLLDVWQKLDGVGVNVLTQIPDLGENLWGNSTLFEVPPATYQALANLSTRYLVNAVENVAYKCGLSITFQYNNDEAYAKFYAGVTPILDTMRNVGAIVDYRIEMAADINGLDQVNANTVIGKIWLVINGVVNDIYVDLIALPPGSDLSAYTL